MAEILVCPTGAVSPTSKRQLSKAGVIVVETDDPSRVQFVRAGEVVSSRDMLWAAMKALQYDKYSAGEAQRQEFTKLIFGLVDADHKRQVAEEPPAIGAVDPPVADTGTPTPRVGES